MPREFSRTRRLSEQFQREIAGMLQREVKDPRLRGVTVSGVEVSRDLAHAKIYVSCLDDKVEKEILKALEHASGFLRSGLARRIKIRSMPRLHYYYDKSLATGERLSSLIDQAVSASDHPPGAGEDT